MSRPTAVLPASLDVVQRARTPDLSLLNPPTRRRRVRAGFISSLSSLAIEPQPFATTPNAKLFHARVTNTPTDDHERVVVKTMLLASADDDRAAFSDDPIRELHVAAHIADRGGHPNIVRCLGAFLESDATHLVMECCGGGDLLLRLERSSGERLPAREALDVLLQVARGLQFLHLCNIAHRDVSVENVLVSSDNTCKLCDFGLSIDADMVSTTTVGKAHYMAPEVVAKVAYSPVRADIWSLGILFFILLTGSPLFKIASASANDFCAFKLLGVHGVLKLWKMDELFSSATLDLLDGMLQVHPSARFQTVTEILDHPALLAAAARRLAAQEAQH